MSNSLFLNSTEQTIFIALAVLLVAIPLLNWLKKDPINVWSPLSMISLVFFYYAVAGPYLSLLNDDTYYRLVEHRPFFFFGWYASLIAIICTIIGFQLIRKTSSIGVDKSAIRDVLSDVDFATISKVLVIIAMISLIVLFGTGGIINQFDAFNSFEATSTASSGAFRNYFLHMMNLFTGAACYLLVATFKRRRMWIWFVVIVMLSLAIYTRQGFRWRHVTLGMSLLATFYLLKNRRISILAVITFTFLGLIVTGFIGSTRKYGKGLSVEDGQNYTSEGLIMTGLEESNVFMTTGYLIADMDFEQDFIGWDPIIQTLAMPIPRTFWPQKPSGSYIQRLFDLYRNENENVGYGVAVLNVGEYYMMFGMFSLVIGFVLLGILMKAVWVWFLKRRNNPLAIVAYAVFFSYLYVVVSRGYLPQVVMLFMFTVFPLFWIYKRQAKKLRRKEHLKQLMSASKDATDSSY